MAEVLITDGKERLLEIGTERICSCAPTHINCMTAKECIKNQLGVRALRRSGARAGTSRCRYRDSFWRERVVATRPWNPGTGGELGKPAGAGAGRAEIWALSVDSDSRHLHFSRRHVIQLSRPPPARSARSRDRRSAPELHQGVEIRQFASCVKSG